MHHALRLLFGPGDTLGRPSQASQRAGPAETSARRRSLPASINGSSPGQVCGRVACCVPDGVRQVSIQRQRARRSLRLQAMAGRRQTGAHVDRSGSTSPGACRRPLLMPLPGWHHQQRGGSRSAAQGIGSCACLGQQRQPLRPPGQVRLQHAQSQGQPQVQALAVGRRAGGGSRCACSRKGGAGLAQPEQSMAVACRAASMVASRNPRGDAGRCAAAAPHAARLPALRALPLTACPFRPACPAALPARLPAADCSPPQRPARRNGSQVVKSKRLLETPAAAASLCTHHTPEAPSFRLPA